jgi:ABC-2 type transport system ATP-binding protein
VLAAIHLTRRFDSRLAVDDVTFEIGRGEIVALLGPNGAGKTTTLRMLAGLIQPSAGEVQLDGEPVSHGNASRLRARVGLLTETPGLWDRLTVRENLYTYARLYGLDSPKVAVERALLVFDIADRGDEPAAVLSKGLKQRVALARTLLHNPDIVLLDEPTSGLDPESARDVRELIVNLRNDNRAILLSTHNLDEVDRVATRVAVLRQRLLAVGTAAALKGRLFGLRVRVELASPVSVLVPLLRSSGYADLVIEDHSLSIAVKDPVSDTPPLVHLLVEAGAAIVSVMREERSLEDVYLRLIQRPELADATSPDKVSA